MFILHPVPSPAEERESLAMRMQQVLNQCQTNEGGREASSQAHTLHPPPACGQEGCGVTGTGDGSIACVPGTQRDGASGLLEVGGCRGQLGTLSNVPPMPGLPGKQI